MSKRKDRKYRVAAPPPGDAANYILVQTKEGPYWRRKRGTVKKAGLNATLKKYADATAIASPAAKRIKRKLDEYLHGLHTARFIANVSARLRESYMKNAAWGFSFLERYDLQPDYPMGELLKTKPVAAVAGGEIIVDIRITQHTLKPLNKAVSDYYFDLILLWGDPSRKNGLRVDSETSSLYTIGARSPKDCHLSLVLPLKGPWMALLKVSTLEGDQPAGHPRHYACTVVRTG